MRRAAVVLSFLAALAFPGALLAHEGEVHKIVGTVTCGIVSANFA